MVHLSLPSNIFFILSDSVTYDDIGNPINYFGHTFKWQFGRLLSKVGNDIEYTYNYDNIRCNKIVDGIKTKYYLDGNKVIAQESNGDKLFFIYGSYGIEGFYINEINNYYIYQKNLQGDITHVYNSSGVLEAEYRYDAWGNHEVINHSSMLIGDVNPFRYRSYYFDEETGLYHLNSRYYDPEVGRFINADDVSYLDPESINGLNLYAYCGCNPVMNVDPTGHFFVSFLISCIIFGAIIGGGSAGYKAYNEGQRGWDLFGDIAGGALLGGAMGAAMALGGAAGLASTGIAVTGFGLSAGAAFGISVGITALAGMGAYSLQTLGSSTNKWDFEKMYCAGVESALQGAATFGLSFLGGRMGLFNSKLTDVSNSNFLQHIFNTTGQIGLRPAIVYGLQLGFGYQISKALLLTLPSAIVKYIIEVFYGGATNV